MPGSGDYIRTPEGLSRMAAGGCRCDSCEWERGVLAFRQRWPVRGVSTTGGSTTLEEEFFSRQGKE